MATVPLEKIIPSTLDFADADHKLWDVIIIGAGPTGSLAARQLALAGAKVLLVDRISFPRWKVCGCCLSGRALAILKQVGLLEDLSAAGAISLNAFELQVAGQSLSLSLPSGLSLSRTQLDALLIHSAITAGADFLPETEARLGSRNRDFQEVVLNQRDERVTIRGKTVLVCEGLNPRLLGHSDTFSNSVDESSFIGAGAVAPIEQGAFPEGTISMSAGRAGYVGAVLVEGNLLNLAAAINPGFLKEGVQIGTLIQQILREAECTLPVDVEQLRWQGTAKLTRKTSPVASGRVLVLGDASGYVEPFTGEGMGWGLASAVACVPLVLAGLKDRDDALAENWIQYHRRHIQGRQRWCRRCAYVLKRPLLAKGLIHIARRCPWIAAPMLRQFNSP